VDELDRIDLNAVLKHLVAEETHQSLTYSATEESYLFESMPMDATHTALEHLSGVVLYQEMPSPPDSPFSGLPPLPQPRALDFDSERDGSSQLEHDDGAGCRKLVIYTSQFPAAAAPAAGMQPSPFALANFPEATMYF